MARAATCAALSACTWAVCNSPTVVEARPLRAVAEMLLIDLVLMDWMSVDMSVSCEEVSVPTCTVLRPAMAEVDTEESKWALSRAATTAVLN